MQKLRTRLDTRRRVVDLDRAAGQKRIFYRESGMQRCENCGNEYRGTFQIVMGDQDHFFDCFECAINALAPRCAHCGTRVIGHGIEGNGKIFCCTHCAKSEGVIGSRDHVL